MKFVNRHSEQERLKNTLSKDRSAFVVLYGRRRCGKSTLLKRILEPNDIYFMADQTEASYQRTLFANVIEKVIQGFSNVIYPNWQVLFDNLNNRISQRITICLDEFPYLVKSAPELPSVLQKILDNKEELRFNLVLCGSSQQLMHGLVLDSSAPLFGRADEIMKIKPMRAAYLQEVLECSAIETVEEYSVWGGVPRYWELRKEENSLEDALKYHVFSSLGILYDEPMRLFLDDMRDTVHSFTILSLIASGCHRLSEIAARLGKPATSLTAPLDKLLMLGYLEKEIPFGENPKKSKKSLYKIADPFIRFYFQFVVPNRSFIEVEQVSPILHQLNLQFGMYISSQWEQLCRDTVPFLKIDGIEFGKAARWWTGSRDEQTEIDVVAESLDGQYILVGECKWSDKTLNIERLFCDLRQKATRLSFVDKREIIYCMFLKNKTLSSEGLIFTAEDIIHTVIK